MSSFLFVLYYLHFCCTFQFHLDLFALSYLCVCVNNVFRKISLSKICIGKYRSNEHIYEKMLFYYRFQIQFDIIFFDTIW